MIVQFALGIAEHDRQRRRGRNCLELRAGFQAGEEQRIDAGSLIGLGARNAIVKACSRRTAAPRSGAAHDHQRRIAARIERGLHLADALLERNQLRLG